MCSPDLFRAIASVSQMVKEDATLFEGTLELQAAGLNSDHTFKTMQYCDCELMIICDQRVLLICDVNHSDLTIESSH